MHQFLNELVPKLSVSRGGGLVTSGRIHFTPVQSSETTNRRLRLAVEQLHGQQLSDFENEDTDSLEEPDELVD